MINDIANSTDLLTVQVCLLLRGYSLALLILTHFLQRSTGAEIDTYSPEVKAVLSNFSNAMARNLPYVVDNFESKRIPL